MKLNELCPRWSELATSVQSRIRIEAKIVKRVIEAVLDDGHSNYTLHGIDLDEGIELTPTLEDAMKLAFDLDDARLYFKHRATGKLVWVYFVFGNDGWDVVNDYVATGDSFEIAVERSSGDDTDNGDEEV